MEKATKLKPAYLEQQIKRFIPPLGSDRYKGQAGKIGVVGGSFEYTGAPYFSAISAMKVGADLGHIFCQKSAATAIKSYSPEVIVHPVLPSTTDSGETLEDEELTKAVEKVTSWMSALTGLVIGPGLGRDKSNAKCAKGIIEAARKKGLPLVVDGDGISSVICTWPDIIKEYPNAILTPNEPEYKRLCKSVDLPEDSAVKTLSTKLGVAIVRKGSKDKISDGTIDVECEEEGGLKRCGGQGDVLTGAIATFLSWHAAHQKEKKEKGDGGEESEEDNLPGTILAGYAGCTLTRHASAKAFKKHGRAMTTTDLIDQVGPAFAQLY